MIKAVILGGARGAQALDSSKSYPLSLSELAHGGRVLDWILQALARHGIDASETAFVGGYHVEKVIQAYPELHYHYHPEWHRQQDAGFLRLVIDELQGGAVICRADIVFRQEALERLAGSEADVAIGTAGPAESEPLRELGLVRLNARGIQALRECLRGQREAGSTLPQLARAAGSGLKMATVDLGEACAELSDPGSLSRFILGSKARTLDRLRSVVRTAAVLEQVRFSVEEWRLDAAAILARVRKELPAGRLIVRSSAAGEDSWSASGAGRYQSVLDVDPVQPQALEAAISRVAESLLAGGGGEAAAGVHEVFVQPCLEQVAASGVLLTRDPERGAPYYLISIDRVTGRTTSVTQGARSPVETWVVSHTAQEPPEDRLIASLLAMVQELKGLLGHDRLDIEFASDASGKLYLLQVRPLICRSADLTLSDQDFAEELGHIRQFVQDLIRPQAPVRGQTTLLGNMPDWNPAEIIGIAPRPLALSLYKTLVTDFAWAEARRRLGYRDVTGEPLMMSLGGVPYIDLRASFNSFAPADLDDRTTGRVVEAALRHLAAHPELHDKIEFEVAVTCMTFDYDEHAARLRREGVTSKDLASLRANLLRLTDAIICGAAAPFSEQLDQLGLLLERRNRLLKRAPPTNLPRLIHRLVQDCVRYGTIPFSILARKAFIAMAILKSLRRRDVFTSDEYQMVLNAIPTVASDVALAWRRLQAHRTEAFIRSYGHLRPGTYDLMSPNYAHLIRTSLTRPNGLPTDAASDEKPQALLKIARKLFLRDKREQIEDLLREHGFTCNAKTLFEFMSRSISGREAAKFEFTKSINEILERSAEFGAAFGLSRREVSYLPIESFTQLATESPSAATGARLKRLSSFNMKRHALTKAIRLPHLITGVRDLEQFQVLEWRPNFVTRKRVVAEARVVDRGPLAESLRGKIVLIESADPGYDWIFSYRPGGLITQFGGAGSHMAIRAAEFGLPSAIGCGALLFERARRARHLELDCEGQQIRVLG
jgi:hypothetical protein